MKKYLLLLCWLFLLPKINFCQNFFIEVVVPYHFGTGGYNYLQQVDRGGAIYDYKSFKFNMAQGLAPEIHAGFMFKKNWGFSLGLGYLLGNQVMSGEYKDLGGLNKYETRFVSRSFLINPALEIKSAGRVRFSFSGGVQLGLGTSLEMINVGSYEPINGQVRTAESTWEYGGNIAFGFKFRMGLEYEINKKISFSGGLSGLSMQWYPSAAIWKKYTIDGVDQLPTMTRKEKEIKYLSYMTYEQYDNNNPNEPRYLGRMAWPFSGWGPFVSLKYTL